MVTASTVGQTYSRGRGAGGGGGACMQDRGMGLGRKKQEACSATGMEHEKGSRSVLLDVWEGACTSVIYLHWSFFIMGPFLGDQSSASETQIMTHRMGGGLMSQKESWVLRPGERAPMLSMTEVMLVSLKRVCC